MVGGGAL